MAVAEAVVVVEEAEAAEEEEEVGEVVIVVVEEGEEVAFCAKGRAGSEEITGRGAVTEFEINLPKG